MRKTCLFLALVALALGFLTLRPLSVRAVDGTVVAPAAQAAVEGSDNNGFPFNIAAFGLSAQRYQQVFAASQFGGANVTLQITRLALRPDALLGGPFFTTIAGLDIKFSTTRLGPGGLSPTFADNVGPDELDVFNGSLTLASAFTGPAGGPMDFDIVINLVRPFPYNPANGNLLLDVRNVSGEPTTQFDAQGALFSGGLTTSTVFGAVDSPAGVSGAASGLVVQFSYSVFPPRSLMFPPGGTIATTGCGTVSPPSFPGFFELGQSIDFTAIPCPDHRFLGWSGGPCDGRADNPCSMPAAAAGPVTANFTP